MSKIRIEQLASELNKYLNEYKEFIEDEVKETSKSISREAKATLKGYRPPNDVTGDYRRGWAIKQQRKGKMRHEEIIWNRTDYQLTHLLEFGHRLVSRDGTVYGHVRAFPHIRPTEDYYQEKFFTELRGKIKR